MSTSVEAADDGEPAILELLRGCEQHSRLRMRDHRALHLGLERIGVGQKAFPRDAFDREDDPVDQVAAQRTHGVGADERVRELPEGPTERDQVDVRRVGVADQVHHRERARQDRGADPRLDDRLGDVKPGGRRVDEQGLARLERRDDRTRKPLLFGVLELEAVPERVLVGRKIRKHRAAVRPSRVSFAHENRKVAAGRHRRDAELLLDGADRDAPPLAQRPRGSAGAALRERAGLSRPEDPRPSPRSVASPHSGCDAAGQLREPAVHELHGHRSLADRGGAPFGRPGAHVARGEDPGHARLEQAVASAAAPVRMKPFSSRATTSPSHSVHGSAPRKRNRNENGEALAARRASPLRVGRRRREARRSRCGRAPRRRSARARARGSPTSSRAGRRGDGAASRARRPRASQTAAWPAELPPPTTPTRDGAAELRLGRAGGVEHAQSLVVGRGRRRGAAGTGRRSRAAPRARRSRGRPRAARRGARFPVRARARGRASRSARRTCAPA